MKKDLIFFKNLIFYFLNSPKIALSYIKLSLKEVSL